MGYTKFGEFVRVLRIKHHEVMGDLAKVLNVSMPFLSSVETGKKNVPKEWIPKIVVHYSLNEVEKKELETAIEESKTQIKLNLKEMNSFKREAAVQFARSFDEMDDEVAKKIMALLERRKDN